MAAKIAVEETGDLEFRVRICDAGSESVHHVTIKRSDLERFTGGTIEPAELIERSFEFLLERESKESILPRFDLSVIGRYFPEYQREIERRLSNR
jgi:hypothetical protein